MLLFFYLPLEDDRIDGQGRIRRQAKELLRTNFRKYIPRLGSLFFSPLFCGCCV